MILDEFVKMTWTGDSIKYYQNLGYEFTKRFDIFNVKIEDLNKNSRIKVNILCDCCGEKLNIQYQSYNRYLKDGKYYCKKCAMRLYGTKKIVETKLKNSISFGDYCIQNIDENFIEKYWGNQNTISPFEITYNSAQSIYIKCLNNSYHGEYKTKPHYFSRGYRCGYCSNQKVHPLDSFGETNKDMLHLWSDKNEKSPFDYKPTSGKKVWWKCENNLHDDYERDLNKAHICGYRCPQCVILRNESLFQEKVRKYLSEDLGYNLNHEYKCNIRATNPKTNRPLPYDNEIIDLKLIIEVMGIQHYKESSYQSLWKEQGRTSKEQLIYNQWKDKIKKAYALSQGYSYLDISYKTEKNESYKALINNKIKEILKDAV